MLHNTIVIGAVERSVWLTTQNGQSYRETPDCLILRDAGQVHSVRSDQVDAKGGKWRSIEIPPGALDELYRAHADTAFPQLDFRNPVIENRRMRDMFVEAHKAGERADSKLEQSTYLTLFLAQLARTAGKQKLEIKEEKSKCHVRDVKDYIIAHFNRNISLKELAELTHTNSFVLLRQFKREVNVTPHEFLYAYRAAQARRMILDGFKLSDVAATCGFSDQSHLTRVFKRMVGVTPGQFLPVRKK